jgi:hypothetical protein
VMVLTIVVVGTVIVVPLIAIVTHFVCQVATDSASSIWQEIMMA